jgi:hypothetical protein
MSEQTELAQPGELQERPANTRILSNGAVYDMDRHRIAGNPPGGTLNKITTQTTQEMHERRREQARLKYIAGMKRGLKVPTFGAAIECIGEAQAQIAADPARGRAATYAMVESFKFLDLAPDKHENPVNQPAMTLTLSAAAVDQVLELARRGLERDNG